MARALHPEQKEDLTSSDVIFHGIVRKWNSQNVLISIEDTSGESGKKGPAWYRACDATMATVLRRFAPGDRIIVRVRGDLIVRATHPLDDRVKAAQDERASTNGRKLAKPRGTTRKSNGTAAQTTVGTAYLEQRYQEQEARGKRTSPTERAEAEARLRALSANATFVPVADIDTSKHEKKLEALKLKPCNEAAGVAFNVKLSTFSIESAVQGATNRLGKAPNRYCFHRGMLYLSRS